MKKLRVNWQIRAPKVVLIDENNKPLGMLPLEKARMIAQERGFDLVEVSPKAVTPVCKLMDYGAYRYRQEKAEQKQKARQKKVEVKAIRLTLKIGKHDLEVKKSRALKFLEKGDKVKIEMILRGREMAHQDLGREIIENFIKELGEKVITEQILSRQGNRFSTTIYFKK